MAVSSSPILSPFRMKITATEFVSPSSTLPRINFCNNRRQSPAVVLASKSEKESWSEAKRVLMEQYGFNPDEALSPEPSPNVLGGKARRMKLLSPKGMDVRPMMEVVKGAAFDILQAAGGCPASLRPGRWLDLYSGTGSVGIEAISRGCSEVHFVEMDPWVVSDVLRPNLEWTGFLDMSVIHTVRVEKFMERAQKLAGKEPFDYISVTPPYMEVDYAVLMDQISSSDLVGEDTFIVVEYPLRTDMLDSCGCLVKITDRRFGRTHLAIYGPKWAQKKKKKEKSLRGAAVEI
ncbi:putative rRNA methyltransferase YlbH isoform X2 [Pyrus x bretschneideri]|uniref:putative rRNA methyltransferase YlbH isoform X2 n=1 Tax=Pyrus x bretschneideri TaxID=225117 RepID=UPI00202FA846|nr:putative rRNA methyltransferase YlbH isoform X2 [Pyrus x bretschneideri]